MDHATCTCPDVCNCYYKDRKVVAQHLEEIPGAIVIYDKDGLIIDGCLCVVIYETGEIQKLKRCWIDMFPQYPHFYF